MATPDMTPAERIRELSDINTDVAAMLGSAGRAINALTNRPLKASDEDAQMTDDASNTVDGHKEIFTQNSEAYFTSVQAIFARLKRQAYALEEAGIIPSDSSALGSSVPRPAARTAELDTRGMPTHAPKQEVERIANGGLGKFDVGWLNSRGNKVGEEKEAELVQEARGLLDEVMSRKDGSQG